MDSRENYCTMTEKTYELKEGTKGAYKLTEERVVNMSEEDYDNMTSAETQKFFRRLGGSETATRGYTKRGYKVVEIISKSPDKTVKQVRSFKF